MNEEQEKLIHTMKKIAELVANGKLVQSKLPIEDLTEALKCSLKYKEDSELEDRIGDGFGKLLKDRTLSDNFFILKSVVELTADLMESAYEREAYYKKRETDIIRKAQEVAAQSNGMYEETVNAYSQDRIDWEFLKGHTCQSLVVIKKKGETELFKKILRCVQQTALDHIKNRKSLKIVFFLKDSAEWSCEPLYRRLKDIPQIELSVVVAPFMVGTAQTVNDTYVNTIKYFTDRGFDVTGIWDRFQGRYKSWKEIGLPDIVFHLNPHYSAFLESANICNFPLSILNVYIPYGIMTYGNVEHQFNQMSHMLYWRIFCETSLHKEMAKKYSDIEDVNVVYSGYVKMDSFLETGDADVKEIWKIAGSQRPDQVKKVIYAPHWSIGDSFTGFGNFDKIYEQIYEYAKNHEASTSWIFRPHPMLRAGVVQQGLFKSEQEYDVYLKKWNKLSNARVSENELYTDIFRTSDAMILDSVSFLAEYLYVHKPLLFLTRERNSFNDFGRELKKVLYTANGDDFEKVKEFIEDTVMREKDDRKPVREEFFDRFLNYKKENGMSASEYIWNCILKESGWEADMR